MRIHFRINFGNLTFFSMLSHYQKIEGINSKVSEFSHILLWDFDSTNLKEIEKELIRIQDKFFLSDIFIFSDNMKSFHAYCFTRVCFKDLLKILVETEYVDMDFIGYTIRNKKAVLRTSRKINRENIKLVKVLPSFECKIPEKIGKELYDCPLDKIIKEINLEMK